MSTRQTWNDEDLDAAIDHEYERAHPRSPQPISEADEAYMRAKLETEALLDALLTESKGTLRREPTVPPYLRATHPSGATSVLVTVHSGDAVTIDCYGVPAAVALRIVQLLGEVMP